MQKYIYKEIKIKEVNSRQNIAYILMVDLVSLMFSVGKISQLYQKRAIITSSLRLMIDSKVSESEID